MNSPPHRHSPYHMSPSLNSTISPIEGPGISINGSDTPRTIYQSTELHDDSGKMSTSERGKKLLRVAWHGLQGWLYVNMVNMA